MNRAEPAACSRRALLKNGLLLMGGLAVPACAPTEDSAAPELADSTARVLPRPAPAVGKGWAPQGVRTRLFERAKAALDTHGGRIERRDRIAIADFELASARPRFHLIDLEAGKVRDLLVAHGSGSDPGHTGYLQRFSNMPDSNATSRGAYVTADYYVGKHGRSQRLVGLDPTNDNALTRAIVVHGAWYANREMVARHGKLGRSQGCFAVGERELRTVFDHLGEGRMIYASAKV